MVRTRVSNRIIQNGIDRAMIESLLSPQQHYDAGSKCCCHVVIDQSALSRLGSASNHTVLSRRYH